MGKSDDSVKGCAALIVLDHKDEAGWTAMEFLK